MVTPALPQELIDAIIDEVGALKGAKNRLAALKACVATSPLFAPRSQLHIFHRLILRVESKCATWAARLAAAPHIGTYVHDIDIVGGGGAPELDLSAWPALPAVLRACTNLDYLGLWRVNVNRLPDLPTFHALVPVLRRLMFRDCFASYEVLEELLTTFPTLQELKLGAMDMTGLHAPPAELPPVRLRRLAFLPGITMGGGGHGYGERLGGSIGSLDELKIGFDYSEHFDFIRDMVKFLAEGPATLRLAHSNRDSPPTKADIEKMNLGLAKHLRCLQLSRIDLSASEPTHWETHFLGALDGTLEHVYLEYIADADADVAKWPWDRLDAALGRARQPDLQGVWIAVHGGALDRAACVAEVERSLPLLRARNIVLQVQ